LTHAQKKGVVRVTTPEKKMKRFSPPLSAPDIGNHQSFFEKSAAPASRLGTDAGAHEPPPGGITPATKEEPPNSHDK
jgi:hypothetical protein